MLTGKIYKNKLSSQCDLSTSPEPYNQSKTIGRVKSQPGLKINFPGSKVQNVENYELVKTKNINKSISTDLKFQQLISQSNQKVYQSFEKGESATSEYVIEFQRKIREHVTKIQQKYQIRIGQLESALQAKNLVILQLKQALLQRERIIDRLQKQSHDLNSLSRLSTPRHQ